MAVAPQYSLVIPAYNEAGRLAASLAAVDEYCTGLGLPWEAVVVVEKSTDETADLARAAAAKQANFLVIANEIHRGKGFAVRTGVRRATGAVVFFMDADLSVPLPCIGEFLDYFAAHPEVAVAVGNRRHPASAILRRQSWLRRSLGQTFNALLRLLLPVGVRDTQCGFKAFRRAAARDIFARQTIDGFAFDVEVLLLAARRGHRVVDLPVRWVNSPESKVRILRDSLVMLRDTARLRRRLRRPIPHPPGAPGAPGAPGTLAAPDTTGACQERSERGD